VPYRSQAGFTLIEVLIALAILSIALSAILHTIGSGIELTTNLRDRQLALWVAQNRLIQHQVQKDFPSPDQTTGTTEMGGREWHWTEQVASTPEPALRRIEIQVRLDPKSSALTRLVGFLEKASPQ